VKSGLQPKLRIGEGPTHNADDEKHQPKRNRQTNPMWFWALNVSALKVADGRKIT
jgi:hypothetical protein